jgi:hypothetical protein
MPAAGMAPELQICSEDSRQQKYEQVYTTAYLADYMDFILVTRVYSPVYLFAD